MNKAIKTISILGCGWLGFPLGKALVKAGYTVKGATTSPEKQPFLRKAGIRPYLIRVEDEIAGKEIADFFQTDLLIVTIPPGRRRPNVEERYPRQIRAIVKTSLEGTVTHLLFTSSSSVYGNTNGIVTEATPPGPESSSGRALVEIENYLRSQRALQVNILRLAGLVGGDRKAGRFLAGRTAVANPSGPVNLVHREDCIGVILKILEKDVWGETFNVCADQHPTRAEFYTYQARKEGLEPPDFAPDGEPSFKIVSNEKVKDMLGYAFVYGDPMGW